MSLSRCSASWPNLAILKRRPRVVPGVTFLQRSQRVIARDRMPLAMELSPDLDGAKDGEVVAVDPEDRRFQLLVTMPSSAAWARIREEASSGRKVQCFADWLDAPPDFRESGQRTTSSSHLQARSQRRLTRRSRSRWPVEVPSLRAPTASSERIRRWRARAVRRGRPGFDELVLERFRRSAEHLRNCTNRSPLGLTALARVDHRRDGSFSQLQ